MVEKENWELSSLGRMYVFYEAGVYWRLFVSYGKNQKGIISRSTACYYQVALPGCGQKSRLMTWRHSVWSMGQQPHFAPVYPSLPCQFSLKRARKMLNKLSTDNFFPVCGQHGEESWRVSGSRLPLLSSFIRKHTCLRSQTNLSLFYTKCGSRAEGWKTAFS